YFRIVARAGPSLTPARSAIKLFMSLGATQNDIVGFEMPRRHPGWTKREIGQLRKSPGHFGAGCETRGVNHDATPFEKRRQNIREHVERGRDRSLIMDD